MRNSRRERITLFHRGTSVLAALVFVAIFVLFMAGAKMVAPGSFGDGQSAAIGVLAKAGDSQSPAAQISCQPKVADVGMTIGIAFGCANAVKALGSGFSTNDALWGATTALISERGSGVVNYVLACPGETHAAMASCAVEVSTPIVLLATQKKEFVAGEDISLAWLTRGVRGCMLLTGEEPEVGVASARYFDESGVITIPAIAEDENIILRCTTAGGASKEARVSVKVTPTS